MGTLSIAPDGIQPIGLQTSLRELPCMKLYQACKLPGACPAIGVCDGVTAMQGA